MELDMRVRVRLLSLVLVAVFLAAFFVRAAGGTETGSDYVLLLDCTGTMRYGGRGEAVIEVTRDFIQDAGPGDRISVFGFGEEPQPLMDDYPATVGGGADGDDVFSRLRFPFEADRTDMTRGLELVWAERERVFPRLYGSDSRKPGKAWIVLVTDGQLIPVYDDYSRYDAIYDGSRKRLLELAGLFAADGVRLSTVCLGPEEKVDNDLMARVAELGGGTHYHAASSPDLAASFAAISGALAPDPVERATDVAVGEASQQKATGAGLSAEARGAESSEAAVAQAVSSSEHESTSRMESSLVARYSGEDLRELVYQSIVGILGVAIGFVAIGIHRHESWARAFTKPLLKREIRVRGYLKPHAPSDVMSARAAIPIENPGLPAIEVGEGAEQGAWLRGVLVEFVGSPDDSPPTIRVHKGEVTVEDQPVEGERKLQDGDCIRLGDECYHYLRGTRR